MNANKAEAPASLAQAEFGNFVESRVARLKTRTYDFGALKFQADFDPKYRRAQMRYIGTGAAGVTEDENVVPAEHFTLSTMLLPGGAVGPLHLHDDVEEVFFVLRGSVKVMAKKGDLYYESRLNERDLISVPPGVYRGVVNDGEEDVIMCVLLGSPKPRLPTYQPDDPLSKIDRHK